MITNLIDYNSVKVSSVYKNIEKKNKKRIRDHIRNNSGVEYLILILLLFCWVYGDTGPTTSNKC